VAEEMCIFQEKWAFKYLFLSVETIAVMKVRNLKKHCQTEHASKYNDLEGHFQSDNIKS
jgi:hypothetical protein